jgi:ATP-dependent Clp protease adaptor protein ClpS
MARHSSDSDSEVLTRKKSKTKKPQMYKVILHNDDYTSMEFVVMILETIFYKPPVIANQIMLRIHKEGSGVCGVFTRDVAESKVSQVEDRAMEYGYPLLCTMEQA